MNTNKKKRVIFPRREAAFRMDLWKSLLIRSSFGYFLAGKAAAK